MTGMDSKSTESPCTHQVEAALAVRRLAHALVAHDAGDALLDEIAKAAHRWAAVVEQAPRVVRPAHAVRHEMSSGHPSDGAPIEHFDRCPVSGPANPLATDLTARRNGDDVRCEVVLGPAHEGVPGRAHGGVVAALFDDATAFLTRILDETCVGSELTVHFRRPVPIGQLLRIDARVARRDGRRIYTEATMHHGDTTVARAKSTKVIIDS
jgi:acyl-coenzyme A thioesterase PaaI-like protein